MPDKPRGRISSLTSLILVLLLFGAIVSRVPLAASIQIGADEGFELTKATLCLKGFKLYSDVWNDQPPLHTFLVTAILKHWSLSVLGPRLLTVAFSCILITALFLISRRLNGLVVAGFTGLLLIASPGFIELGSSCMLEIPGLATAIAAMCLLQVGGPRFWPLSAIASGLLFGAALEIKLINLILLPIVALIAWQQFRAGTSPVRRLAMALTLFAISLLVGFVSIDYLVDGGAFVRHFQQSWESHFAATKSVEYGSPAEHSFDWSILLKNWDTTIPALVGVVVALRQKPVALIPVAWLALSLAVFTIHKPWWPYYYIHNAIPLAWCAGIGIDYVYQQLRTRRSVGLAILLTLFGLASLGWMGARVYLQIRNIRNAPQINTSLLLTQIERLKPYARFIYADESVYSFHAGIPMPPALAVMPLKRFWSGDMTATRIGSEMATIKPEIILLKSGTADSPISQLLSEDYRAVYEDPDCRLYARKTIVKQAGF